MTQWHTKSRTKASGGKRNSVNRSDKRLYQKGGIFAEPKVSSEDYRSNFSTLGGNQKIALLKAANVVFSDEKGKIHKGKLKAVVQNQANRHFERRNIITKGAVLEVEESGKTKYVLVSSRPGQSGVVQGTITVKPEVKLTKKQERAKATAEKKEVEEKPVKKAEKPKQAKKAKKAEKK